MAGLTAAYFISPKGEVIYCGNNHITKILQHPEKFGMTKDIISYIYNTYDEKLGQEGKAREQIIISLVKQGWIRIRKYGDKFWTVNIDKLTRKVKGYLQKWANEMLKGRDGIKEYDAKIPVKIDIPKKKVSTSDMGSIANSNDFMVEGKEFGIKWVNIEDIDNLPIYECFKKVGLISKYI